MSLQLIFWILMLLWLVGVFAGPRIGPWAPMGSNILLFVLLLILGWSQFGQPIQG